jgi:hypothetical protein
MLNPSLIIELVNNESTEPRSGARFHPEPKIPKL